MKDAKKPLSKSGSTEKLPDNNTLIGNRNLRKKPRSCTDRALQIDDNTAHEILKRLPNHNTQYATFAKILIKCGELLTGKANPLGGVNLSNVANSSINPRIEDLGLTVDCRTPEKKIINQHGNQSGQKYWGFYPL